MLRRLLPATVLFALLVPASAQADQGAAVIRDCLNHGRIQGHYSQKAYSQALAEMPADVTEYSDCPNLIRQARLAAASGQGGSGGGGGAGGGSGAGAPPSAASFTPAERQALASVGHRGGAAVDLGGQIVRPGVIHANAASALNSLPTPLLALLIALAAGALAAAGFVGTKRVRARRSH